MERIFLIGPPGAGKTACGQLLAQRLGCEFFDTDHLIEQAEGRTVSAIFAAEGEQRFRELERELLEKLAAFDSDDKRIVYATGGGLPVYNNNISRLEQLGKVVSLSADLSVLVERVRSNTSRPLLAGEGADADKQLSARISNLIAERSAVYGQAGYKIDTSGLSPAQVADEIVSILYGN